MPLTVAVRGETCRENDPTKRRVKERRGGVVEREI